jgi:hypothetical protein
VRAARTEDNRRQHHFWTAAKGIADERFIVVVAVVVAVVLVGVALGNRR